MQIKKKKQNKKYYYYYNGISIVLFIVSYYFYYLSLEKCLYGIAECSTKWNWIILKIKQYLISLSINIVLISLIIFQKISKFHLVHFISVFALFLYYSHNLDFQDHGGYNFIFFCIILFLALLILLLLKVLYSILKIKYKYKIYSIILLFVSYYSFINPINCYDWPQGLNNTSIENDVNKYGCQIIFPKQCNYKILQYIQDLSKITHISCSKKTKNARNKLLSLSKSPYIKKDTLKFGFPLTNVEEGRVEGIDILILLIYTYKNLFDMDKNIPDGYAKPEYIVDFSKDPTGELTIKLNYNKTLSLERKLLEKNSNPYSENILILYLDSVSRNNALRKLKKTTKFIEQFISYKGGNNKNYPNENFHSFQFFKYHSFLTRTADNFPQLFYGNIRTGNNLVRINKYAKENGYITSQASDWCANDLTGTTHNFTKEELYDHQLLFCDRNFPSLNSHIKRCLYGNISSYYLLEYSNQFWRNYQNNRRFSVTLINDAHEGTLELVKYTDDLLFTFLNSLYNDNLLINTTIFLMSDHGCGMPSIYYLNDFFKIELNLPMLFIIIHDRKNINYNEQYYNIQKNQQTLITGYDIYNTISHIIYGDNYSKILPKNNLYDTPKSGNGKSLFERINQKERHPKNYRKMALNVCI